MFCAAFISKNHSPTNVGKRRIVAASPTWWVTSILLACVCVVSADTRRPITQETFRLWSGPPIPSRAEQIPFVPGLREQTIHQATENSDKFLHGAAIIQYQGTLFANWANSPTHENGPQETLRGRRSTNLGLSWSALETIAPGFDGEERHSHGILFEHDGQLWTISARFGNGTQGRRFPGLKAEAFVFHSNTNQWEPKGIAMHNCWPYDEPVRMPNGNAITGGQDRNGLPVVAISHGKNFLEWDTVNIPYPPRLKPSYAETTVWANDATVTAIIRGGEKVAWVSTSHDFGETWETAKPSNFPMPRAKAYAGTLSSGQRYLLANLYDRNTLVIAVSAPGETTLSQLWRIRHGPSKPPRFPGRAKSKQWSYPYGHEFASNLYVVYSIGKEDCGLSILPVKSLATDH